MIFFRLYVCSRWCIRDKPRSLIPLIPGPLRGIGDRNITPARVEFCGHSALPFELLHKSRHCFQPSLHGSRRGDAFRVQISKGRTNHSLVRCSSQNLLNSPQRAWVLSPGRQVKRSRRTKRCREKVSKADRLPACVEVISKRVVHGGTLVNHCISVGNQEERRSSE